MTATGNRALSLTHPQLSDGALQHAPVSASGVGSPQQGSAWGAARIDSVARVMVVPSV
jgi:hypothetical protein